MTTGGGTTWAAGRSTRPRTRSSAGSPTRSPGPATRRCSPRSSRRTPSGGAPAGDADRDRPLRAPRAAADGGSSDPGTTPRSRLYLVAMRVAAVVCAFLLAATACRSPEPTPAPAARTVCPITRPDPAAAPPPWIAADAGGASGTGWLLYGDRAQWVRLPEHGELTTYFDPRLPPEQREISMKFLWYR